MQKYMICGTENTYVVGNDTVRREEIGSKAFSVIRLFPALDLPVLPCFAISPKVLHYYFQASEADLRELYEKPNRKYADIVETQSRIRAKLALLDNPVLPEIERNTRELMRIASDFDGICFRASLFDLSNHTSSFGGSVKFKMIGGEKEIRTDFLDFVADIVNPNVISSYRSFDEFSNLQGSILVQAYCEPEVSGTLSASDEGISISYVKGPLHTLLRGLTKPDKYEAAWDEIARREKDYVNASEDMRKVLAFLIGTAGRIRNEFGNFTAEWVLAQNVVYLNDLSHLKILRDAASGAQKRSPKHAADFIAKKKPIVPGNASGRIRIIQSVSEMDALEKGDILVAECALPDWCAAFNTIAAIITEKGGDSCHLATLAREAAVPSIFGVEDAIEKLEKHTHAYITEEGEIYGK